MKKFIHIILISFVSFTIISCAKDSETPSNATVAGVTSTGSDGTNGKNSLISSTTESSGTNCTTGGLKIQSGLDSDEDGVLDSTEVTATSYICNGTVGTNGTNGTNGDNGTVGTNGTNGDNGTNGTNGTDGDNGTNGTNGTNGIKPASSLYCGAILENTVVWFTYTAMVFSDGSVYAYGSIYSSEMQIGRSRFYDSSQSGASTAQILFTWDLSGSDNGGYWEISLNRSTLVVTILYTDSDESGGSTTWTLNSSSNNCVLNSF